MRCKPSCPPAPCWQAKPGHAQQALPTNISHPHGWLFYGSSRIAGESGFDLQEEVLALPVTIRDPLHHLDPVVDAFQLADQPIRLETSRQ